MQHNETKIQLSQEESDLVINAQILLTKNAIIQKVYELFGQVAEVYSHHITNSLPEEVLQKPPKISRGENYEGLPYVMLDYPRHFLKEDTFAIRTFFWWGNFFSITIQLSGTYYDMFLPKFIKAAHHNLLNDWYIGIHDNKWLHDFRETNYAMLRGEELIEEMQKDKTLKLAKKIPLKEWDNAINFFEESFKLLMSIAKT